jgi:hypothetical protein
VFTVLQLPGRRGVQVLHLCSIIAPNQDLTFCLSLVWATIQFAMSSFFVNFREVSQHSDVLVC